MVDLPEGNEGLAWIARHQPSQLLLIPGLQAATIVAAANGHPGATAYLRFTAQQHLAVGKHLKLHALDSLFLAASTSNADRDAWQQRLKTDDDLKWRINERMAHSADVLQQAVRDGSLEAFKWLQVICSDPGMTSKVELEELMALAAENGRLDIMKHLHHGPTRVPLDQSWTGDASGHPACIKWLVENTSCVLENYEIRDLIKQGDLATLRWLWQRRSLSESYFTDHAIEIAAAAGHLEILQWLMSLDARFAFDAFATANAAGSPKHDMTILQWLRNQDPPCPWNELCTEQAAACGKLSLLQWLRSQDPPCAWDDSCSAAAAANGDIKMLKWMRQQCPPCPWSDPATTAAAGLNSSHVLGWLCEQGCKLDPAAACIKAFRCNSHSSVQWLHKEGRIAGLDLTTRNTFGLPRPSIMFLGDLGCQLDEKSAMILVSSRKRFCAFYGLLRWCKSAIFDPSKGAHLVFDSLACDTSGQELLANLALLPEDLVRKIAIMADLQHDFQV